MNCPHSPLNVSGRCNKCMDELQAEGGRYKVALELILSAADLTEAFDMAKHALYPGVQTEIAAAIPDATKPVAPPAPKAKDKNACCQELGYAWIYMHYLRPGWLEKGRPGYEGCIAQKKRVKTLMMECAVEWHRDDKTWWESFYDRIIDEIENMC